MRKKLKIALITVCSIAGAVLLAIMVAFLFFPDRMGETGVRLSRMTGTEIDTVYVDELKAVRGDIVDCSGRIIATSPTGDERQYPCGDLARQTIGLVPHPGDSVKVGIEGAFNRGLSGRDGYYIARRSISTGKTRFVRKVKAKDGARIPITMDMEMQFCADSILRVKLKGNSDVRNACVIMASTNSGAIRSMVNLTGDDDGYYREASNLAIGNVYAPGMMIAPASAITARRCNPATDLGSFNLDSPEELLGVSVNDDIDGYCDTLYSLIEGGYSDWHLEIKGLAGIEFFDGDWRALTCGLCLGAPALTWLRLYTAIARGGDGIALRLVGLIVDEDNCILNEGLFLGSDSYTFCTKEEADVLTASMKVALTGDLLTKARFGVAGLYGDSSDDYGMQSGFAGFFPADDPAFSIICTVGVSPEADSARIRKLISEVVYEIVNNDVIADRVRLSKGE